MKHDRIHPTVERLTKLELAAIEEADPTIKVRPCRVCGYNDNDCTACIAAQGHPCRWIQTDL